MTVSAVITADIVNSTMFSPAEEKKFRDRMIVILKPHRFEFYRGDSFQVMIRDPATALKTVLAIRIEARKISPVYDVRCSIGIGQLNPRIKKLSTATDEAFILSGRAFDALSAGRERMVIACTDQKINYGLKAVCFLLDYLIGNLTEKQAEVIGELLQDNTQTSAARKLKKSPSTINKHAQAAGWDEIVKAFEVYDQLISTL